MSYGGDRSKWRPRYCSDVLASRLAETEPMKIDDTLADVEGIAYTIR